ncbi:protease-associated domain-containing protein 1-like [Littorina saxatilis]|uniref:PA domain-containing protein n=1 Tax=Littorina saxatilis TaxID=31220 RepID=A0AAN9BAK5_9CAEN
MNRTLVEFCCSLLLFTLFVSRLGLADDDSEQEAPVEYRYEIASSPDANLVYEDTYYFEIVSPESLSYTYKLRQAKNFGGSFDRQYKKIRLVIAEPVEACRKIENPLGGAVALVLRGGCSFITKSNHAESAGALAVIIADNDVDNDDHMVDMVDDETGRAVGIPSMFLMGKDGVMIRRHLMMKGLTDAIINIPVNLTGQTLGSAKLPPWTLW